jgi:hypothetical protein
MVRLSVRQTVHIPRQSIVNSLRSDDELHNDAERAACVVEEFDESDVILRSD